MARLVLVSFVASLLLGCAGAQNRRDESDQKLIPEETQKKSQQLQGQQQNMMMDLNMTPGEQAAQSHFERTTPVENPKYSKEDEEK